MKILHKEGTGWNNRIMVLSIAVPVVSFGGMAIAILLQDAGIIANAGTFSWGCVAGAVILGYLAYLMPKRDLVSLCTPLFAFLIFIVPMEYTPTLLLQGLFAASISFLVYRLHSRFSLAEKYKGGTDPMERFLDNYIERMRQENLKFPAATSHEIASAFLAFKFGLYANAARECTQAISLIPDGEANAALKKALMIVRASAHNLDNSQVTPDLSIAFDGAERKYTVVNLPSENVEDPGTYELDNALAMIYVAALITSADDEDALTEHRKFVIRLLTGYKKALGLK